MLTFFFVTALCVFCPVIFIPLTIGYLIGGGVMAVIFLVGFFILIGLIAAGS